ncbi:hypothetical protein RND81_08G124800 [Saponaria officinalis]|uniref:Bifunctional inhibitor/plant lipid transfer protein/seed storage helical domain-containing protein n=1 Tax=Saponaria officinalis TaxID=3572 RepID=A0AAW1J885_SAPOF
MLLMEKTKSLSGIATLPQPNCVSALAPCTPFINSTTLEPTSECCKPLYNALNSTLTCVCSIYGNSDFIQKLKFNAKAVLSLPMRCGLEFDLLSGCAGIFF